MLRRLDLYFNMVGDEGGVAIAEALTSSSSCCCCCRRRPHSSSTPLRSSSSSSTRSLTYLYLTYHYHYHYHHHQALTVNSALRVLHLDNNRVGDPTALALAKSLKVGLALPLALVSRTCLK